MRSRLVGGAALSTRAEPLLLLALGAATSVVAAGSDLTVYVRPGVRWSVLAGGLIMTAVAVATLGTRPEQRRSGLGWLLLAPVLVLAVVAPPPLGALSADRPPTPPPRHDGGFPALPARAVVTLRVSDVVLRTVWGRGRSLRGRTLRVVGFVARSTADGFVLARLVITCCAADARPYDLAVRWPAGAPARGTWVAVVGRYLGASPADHLVPVLAGRRVNQVEAPARPYE